MNSKTGFVRFRENNGDVYDFMRYDQLAQIDSLFQFVAPSWMNDRRWGRSGAGSSRAVSSG